MTHTVLFSEQSIRARVEAVAEEIVNAPHKLDIALPILVGGFIFAADLLRALALRGLVLPVEFLWLRSYAGRNASDVRVLAHPPDEMHGRNVLVMDGVLDHGHTLARARDMLFEQGAATVRTVVAVDKRRVNAVLQADHALFRGVTDFIIGYGMDEAGENRGLPCIMRRE